MARGLLGIWMVGLLGCGGGVPVTVGDGGSATSSLSGLVVLGPAAGATVVAYRSTEALQRGPALGQGVADGAGAFSLALPPYQGHLLLVASGGTYLEPSTGLEVHLGDVELELVLPAFKAGARLEGLRVTPISTLAAAFARFHVQNGTPAAQAVAEAFTHLDSHFGGVDWAHATPTALTDAGAVNLSPDVRAGLILAGLSSLSGQQATAAGLSAGLVVNTASLTAALAKDASDGTLDGKAGTTALSQASTPLSGQTLRADLVRAITAFLTAPRNASSLQLQDVGGLLEALGTDADAYLFCPGQQSSEACAPASLDIQPPTLTFLKPAAEATVSGAVAVELSATDNVHLKSLRFTAPASLAGATPSFSVDGRRGTLATTLDVSQLPAGPVALRAEAVDDSGNPGSATLLLLVDNSAPTISVAAPRAGAFYSGAALVDATATAAGSPLAGFIVSTAVTGTLLDADPALSHLLAPSSAWALPPSVPDGPLDFVFRASTAAGAVSSTVVRAFLDRTPPLATVVTPPPAYTREATASFTVRFTDSGAGFARAQALNRSLGEAPVAGTCAAGGDSTQECSFTVPLGPPEAPLNALVVWAEDAAVPPNGGPSAGAPFARSFTATRTVAHPAVAPRPVDSYRSEQGMGLLTDDGGRPLVPARYRYIPRVVALAEGGTVYKVRSKMGPTDDNVPFLRWAVQQRPFPAAPLARAWWTLDSIDGVAPGLTTSGELRPSTDSEAGSDLYELSVVPPRAGILGYTVHFTDAAGNDAARAFTVTYALVGAPVAAVHDEALHGADEPTSLWHFGLSKANYPQALGQPLSIERWTLYNPNPEAVWVSAPLGASAATWREVWTEAIRPGRELAPLPDGPSDGPTGGKWPERTVWFSDGPLAPPQGDRMCGSVYEALWTGPINYDAPPPWGIGGFPGPAACYGIKSFPCSTLTAPVHYEGDTNPGSYLRCEARSEHVTAGTSGAYPLTNALPVTLDTVAGAALSAPAAGTSRAGQTAWLLPPATASGPSSLSLVVRAEVPARGPGSGVLAQDFPLNSTNQQTFRAGWLYRERMPRWWVVAESYCTSWFLACITQTDVYDYEWDAYYFDRTLGRVAVGYQLDAALATDPDDTASTVVHWVGQGALQATFAVDGL